ncbi:MAG TPA: quaternary ammonium compound efflux SMR transporter SugE [Thermoanaerobaculia bacterium]|jgi:quaternary ammonium compound-resistance protein SugE|nr:quaternary ammonium compound efflux SMR transporter SugE [Thermoanaerobaculia bacterium]
MSWLYLIVAGLLEVVWAVTIKSTEGFTRLGPTLLSLGLMGGSFYLLGLAMRDLPTSTGYAVWVGIGAAGTALLGMVFLGESRNPLRLLSLALIVLGVIGLRLAERG